MSEQGFLWQWAHTLPAVLHIDNISERRREVKLWFLLPNKKSVNVKNESPEKISCSSNPTYVLDKDTGATIVNDDSISVTRTCPPEIKPIPDV